jgi:hypothetical protein
MYSSRSHQPSWDGSTFPPTKNSNIILGSPAINSITSRIQWLRGFLSDEFQQAAEAPNPPHEYMPPPVRICMSVYHQFISAVSTTYRPIVGPRASRRPAWATTIPPPWLLRSDRSSISLVVVVVVGRLGATRRRPAALHQCLLELECWCEIANWMGRVARLANRRSQPERESRGSDRWNEVVAHKGANVMMR